MTYLIISLIYLPHISGDDDRVLKELDLPSLQQSVASVRTDIERGIGCNGD